MDPDALPVERVPHGSSDDPDLLDFSANTNPETPDGVGDAYEAALADARSYPPEPPADYRETAASYVGCAPPKVIPTPGGLAAIRLALATHLRPGDTVLVPYPSFGEYAREVRLQGADPEFVPHDEVLDADPEGFEMAIVCNPNNPTGEAYPADALRRFADRCVETGTTLLADEAFLGFTGRESLAGREGVIAARSLTKLFGLPGLRTGFAVATGDSADRLRSARRAWNLGAPALAVGEHCMSCEAFVRETRERVREERARMREALRGDFEVHPSDAPFLLLDTGDRDPRVVCEHAREAGVAIRDATTFRGLDSHVRVAVRTRGENDRLLEVLGDV